MHPTIRPISDDELLPFAQAQAAAFGWEFDPAGIERPRALVELDRTLAAFDGDEVVGTAAVFPFDMTVPGAELPVAGVTWISVKPTHRRRGILRGIMERQLRDVRERGEPLAALWASESIIYGRFGYGIASQTVDLSIDREHTALAHAPEVPGRTRMVSRDDALRDWPAVYDRVRPRTPGFYTRSAAWWRDHRLHDRPQRPPGTIFFVQYEEAGAVRGYVVYRIGRDAEGFLPTSTLEVYELIAEDDVAYTALWQYVFGVDLVKTIEADWRPIDEPLYFMLADPRRLRRRLTDSLWARVVDVPAALGGRRYSVEGRLVLDVHDDFTGLATGRFLLEGGPAGAHCHPTDRSPDMTLSAADLGAAYMGATAFEPLARAGRIDASPGVLRRADAMFTWRPGPWCPEIF